MSHAVPALCPCNCIIPQHWCAKSKLRNKPYIWGSINFLSIVLICVIAYLGCMFVGWIVRLIMVVITNDPTWSCDIWYPWWWCFWIGVLYVFVTVCCGVALSVVIWGIWMWAKCCRGVCAEIGELSEKAPLVGDDKVPLIISS